MAKRPAVVYNGILFSGGHPEDIKEISLSDIYDDLGRNDIDGYKLIRANVYHKAEGGMAIHIINAKGEISMEYYLRRVTPELEYAKAH